MQNPRGRREWLHPQSFQPDTIKPDRLLAGPMHSMQGHHNMIIPVMILITLRLSGACDCKFNV